jgi:hypothetical protein
MTKAFTFFITIIILLNSCTSGRKAMKQGNYDEAVYKAVKRLRSNSDHKKSLETLKQTYPLAQQWHLNRIRDLEARYDRFKWEPIAKEYDILVGMYEDLLRCPACLTLSPRPIIIVWITSG